MGRLSQRRLTSAYPPIATRNGTESKIQNSQENLSALARRYGINQKTVAKWKQRETVADLPTGPEEAESAVLSIAEEEIIVAFRRWTRWIPASNRSSRRACQDRGAALQG